MSITAKSSEDGIVCQFSYGEIETGVSGKLHHLLMRNKDENTFYHAFFTSDELGELKDAITLYLDELEDIEEAE